MTKDNSFSGEEVILQIIKKSVRDAIIMINGDGNITFWNDASTDILGYSQDEVLGKNFHKLIVPPRFQMDHAQAFPKFQSTGDGAAIGKTLELFATHKNGKEFPVELSLSAYKSNDEWCSVGILHDISERKTSEEALLRSEARFRSAFKLPTVGFTITSLDKGWIEINHALELMLGYTLQELENQTWADLTHPDDLAADETQFNRILAGEIDTYRMEKRFIAKSGAIVWTILSVSCVRKPDQSPDYFIAILQDITDQKNIEQALRESEEKYRYIFENVQDTYYEASLDGLMLEISPSVEILSKGQYSRKDLIGSKLESFYTSLDERQAFFTAIMKNGFVSDFELTMINRDGTEVRCAVSSKIVFNTKGEPVKICGNIRNISERKLAEEAVSRERRLLRTLIDNLPDTIYVKDLEGRKVLANPSDWTLMGFSAESEVIGKTDLEIYHSEIGARGFLDDMEILQQKQVIINREEDFINSSGNKTWLHTTKMPLLDEAGNITGLVGIGRDITERKATELKLAQQAEELRDLVATKDRFFSIIAHDLRGPFGAFLNLTRIMVEDLDEMSLSKIQQFAAIMRKSALNIFEMLENLLEWSRMQRGLSLFEPSIINLNNKIASFLQVLIDSASHKNIAIYYDIPEDLEIYADENMIESTFRNLVSNALKFTPKGGRITIEANSTDLHSVIVSVKDSGIGMTREIQDKLFRIDANISRPGTAGESSSGLGLILCKEFVEKHKGKIWVKSEEGKGSTFFFELPDKSEFLHG
jgi:PAS domain S-box-containing protein